MINITIVDDNLLEPVESFNLTIGSLSGDATIGNLDHTMISVIDNDGMYPWLHLHHNDIWILTDITVQFTQESYIVAERSGIAQPELIFSNPSYTDINVTIFNTEIDATG